MSRKISRGRRCSRYEKINGWLIGWGLWSQNILNKGKGFKNRVAWADFSELGVVVQHSNVMDIDPNNKRAEEVDNLIQQLSQRDKTAARVVNYHYTHSGTIRENAASIQLASTTYYDGLTRARKWIAKKLM